MIKIVSGDDDLDGHPAPDEDDDLNPARREGGMRSPVSDAVHFRHGDRLIEGWSLNLSRGGLRAILGESVRVGDEFDVLMGEDTEPRRAKVVWVRDEKDGAIVGVAFLDTEGSVPPPPRGDDPVDGALPR
jgi:hypothetical protein